MNYTSIENDIVDRLAPLVTAGYEVEAMPDNQASNVGIGRRGRITVQVTMAKFGEHKANAPAVVQDEDIYIDIILRARTLRAVGGIYDLCELCRARLIGYVPNNCDIPLSGVDFGGIDPKEIGDSVFMYSLRLKTRTHSVGGPDVDILPLITAITFDDQTTSYPPPTAELFASSYFVPSAGQQVILAWATSGADEVTITGLGVVDAIGSATVTISADTTFTLTVVQGVTTITSSVEIVIGDPFAPATYTLNDTSTPPNQLSSGSIPSGGSAVIVAPDATVLRDGQPFGSVPSGGSIDVPSDCAPCADATFSIDGVQVDTVASGADLDVSVELNGSPVTPTYNSGTKVIGVTESSLSTLSVAVSNANPDVGQSITITATATGFTPTDYYFYAKQGSTLINIGSSVSGVINWTVTLVGAIDIFAQAHDNSASAFNIGGELVTGVFAVITSNLQLYLDPFLSNIVAPSCNIVAPSYPDLSGFNRDGTLVNSPTVYTGSMAANDGGYVDFNGINQRVFPIGAVADFSFIQNTLTFTVMAWVRIDALTLRNAIISNTASAAEKGFLFAFDNVDASIVGLGVLTKALRFSITNGVGTAASIYGVRSNDNVITSVGWHHVAIKMSGSGTAQLYLDGQPIATSNVPQSFAVASGNSTNQLMVAGSLAVGYPYLIAYDGRVGPWMVYSDAKTDAEVEANFDTDKARYGF